MERYLQGWSCVRKQRYMNIAILSNHVYPFHVGGSETVIKNVSEELAKRGHDVHVYGCDASSDKNIGGVFISKCSINNLLEILKKHDKIIVYSDSFLLLNNTLKCQSILGKKITLFPVGMNACLKDSGLKNLLLSNKNLVNFVCHSKNYDDANFLMANDISFQVIPNGVCSKEFSKSNKQYDQKDNFNILCVANTFPKKGHEELLKVCNLISKYKNIVLNICCHETKWQVGKNLQRILQLKSNSLSYKVNWHINLPRQGIIDQYYNNDLFLLCSLKEVAPVCILESCAAGLPWVSFDVGNVSELPGGIPLSATSKDINGYIVPDFNDISNMSDQVCSLLDDTILMNKLSKDGINYGNSIRWKV